MLEVQDVSFKLKFQKEKNNVMVDMLIRKEDTTELLESRPIFLKKIFLEKTKHEEYHSSIKVLKLEKDSEGIWRYRGQKVIETEEERNQIIHWYHDDKQADHPGFKKTL